MTEKQGDKIKKLQLDSSDLFLKQTSFINKKIREISNVDINFTPQKKHLEKQFALLYDLAEQTDSTFIKMLFLWGKVDVYIGNFPNFFIDKTRLL
ncbi:MAG: bacillithiol biosynthesis BshC [Bacteroidota bacterium]